MHSEHVSEMDIVDTITRLIFGEAEQLTPREDAIVGALRLVDHNMALDDLQEMGAYLRSLEVAEMIELVAGVERQLTDGPPGPVASGTTEPRPARSTA